MAVLGRQYLPDYANLSKLCQFNCCEDVETILCSYQDGIPVNLKKDPDRLTEPTFDPCYFSLESTFKGRVARDF
jgi:hypothetical protein